MKPLLQTKDNSLFSNSLFIFLIRFFPSLANVLVVILFSRYLDTAEYGRYQGFWTHLFVISAIACMGAQTFTLTYTPDTIRVLLKKLPPLFKGGFALWLILLSIVFACLQQQTFDIGWLLPCTFLFTYAVSIIAESLLIVFRQFRLLVWINFLYTITFCFFHWLYIKGVCSWSVLFTGLLLLGIARVVVYALPLYRHLKKDAADITIDSFAGYRNLWLHLGVYEISQVLFRWIDKYVVSFIVSSQLFAIYFNGSIDIPFLPLLLGAVGGAGLMRLAAEDKKDGIGSELQLLHQSGRLLSCIVFPLFFFFICFRHEVFLVVFTEKYMASVPVFLVSVMAIPLRAYSFTTILQSRHKGTIINTGAIFDLLLACLLMYPLYLWLGLPGVALSFVISSYLQAAYYLYHTSQLLGASISTLIPYKNWLIKIIVFSTLFIALHYCLLRFSEPQIVLLCGIISVIAVSAISLLTEYKLSRRHGIEF